MLSLISFVGVDSKTNIDDLIKLQNNSNQLLEFGVLYSKTRAGTEPRYPTYNECLRIFDQLYHADLISSLHLCGKEAVDGFLDHTFSVMNLVRKNMGRIQLNLNIKNYNEHELAMSLVELSEHHHIILQSNKSKANLIKEIQRQDMINVSNCDGNINFLFDASGGVGKHINEFKPVYKNYYTGYAGGINPSNVKFIVESIEKVNNPADDWYVDMESGIRTNDWFDVELCQQVINNIINVHA